MLYISIHAPTRGATFSALCVLLYPPEFQSTLPREERLLLRYCFLPEEYFNPRSHERSDDFSTLFVVFSAISIHAPTRGATQGTKLFKTLLYNFNPRSHERSDFMTGFFIAIFGFQSTLPREERLRL